jgi:sugar lactone lactonase YvrE
VTFGGADLDVLYVTSARVEVPAADRPQRPLDGDLFCLRPGVRGLPEPLFAG